MLYSKFSKTYPSLPQCYSMLQHQFSFLGAAVYYGLMSHCELLLFIMKCCTSVNSLTDMEQTAQVFHPIKSDNNNLFFLGTYQPGTGRVLLTLTSTNHEVKSEHSSLECLSGDFQQAMKATIWGQVLNAIYKLFDLGYMNTKRISQIVHNQLHLGIISNIRV